MHARRCRPAFAPMCKNSRTRTSKSVKQKQQNGGGGGGGGVIDFNLFTDQFCHKQLVRFMALGHSG